SNATGCPMLLLNPSTQPHISLQRFLTGQPNDVAQDKVIYQTSGGWGITPADLEWFAKHQLREIKYPEQVAVIIKTGDELLNPQIAAEFYRSQGAEVLIQEGGDHRMSDFEKQLPIIMGKVKVLMD
ncbi:MAG: YqiA/YcfP family alpha/beta fold hydrolase, partial [Psychrobacter sp.]|nr:YqiA/YcfP family alpha/beta fold hydrolase [Psychrobacter sp.]